MSLLACMRCWPCTTRSPCECVRPAPDELLEHRGLRLLGLQEQRVVVVAAEHQDDPRPGADAADADDLAGDVGDAEVLEQVRGGRSATCAGSCAASPRIQSVNWSCSIPSTQLLDRLDERRVADDAPLAVDDVGELVEGLHAVAGAGLGDVGLGPLASRTVDVVAKFRDDRRRRRCGNTTRPGWSCRRTRASPGGTRRAGSAAPSCGPWSRTRCRARRWRSWRPAA